MNPAQKWRAAAVMEQADGTRMVVASKIVATQESAIDVADHLAKINSDRRGVALPFVAPV